MALTGSGYIQRFNCDSVGMSAGAVDTDLYAEGAGSLKLKVSNATSAVITYDFGSDQDLSGLHFGMFGFVAGSLDLKANGGWVLTAQDNAGNYKRWYVGGNDVNYPGRNGFQLYTIDLENTNPDESSGTLSASAIRYLGFRVKTTSKAIKENVWWDNLFTFSPITFTSAATDQITISDLAAWAATNENALIIELTDKVYLARTGIILGSTTAGLHIDFETTGETLVFEGRTVGDGGTAIAATLYQWKLQGNSTGTINYTAGSKSGTSGILGINIQDNTGTCEVDLNDSNADKILIYGGSFSGVTTIDLPNLTGANYECLSTQFVDHGIITHRGFKIDGGWVSVNAKTKAFAFSSVTHLIKNGTIIDPTTVGWTSSVGGSMNIEGVYFSGTTASGPYDIENTSGSLLTVNVQNNDSNITHKLETSGSITISNPVSFKFTVAPSITDYEWRIYSVTAVGSLAGATELDGEEDATADNQTYNYTYTGDQAIAVQIISQPDHDYEEKVEYFTLKSSNQDVGINLAKDENN